MNREERRRRAREERKQGGQKEPVLIAGDGIVAASLDHKYEAKARAQLPEKQPGKHRWIATAAWIISDPAVASASDPDTLKFLDNENLFSLAIGCWDCEMPLGAIEPDSVCPARGAR